MKTTLAWIYYALCMLFAVAALFPLGLLIVGAACVFKAWTPTATVPSINPLLKYDRFEVDSWTWPINAIYGNPEDGVSGIDAFGPSWVGPYNTRGSRWEAFRWSGLRNWANGFGYITWIFGGTPPLLVKEYRLPILGMRQLKLGWQQRYGRNVMVGSA